MTKGSWGFAFADGMDAVSETIAEAASVARTLRGSREREQVNLAPADLVRANLRSRAADSIRSTSIDEKVASLTDICKRVVGGDRRIHASNASYQDVSGEKCIVTSDGGQVQLTQSIMHLSLNASAKGKGRLCSVRDENGFVDKGWEFLADDGFRDEAATRLITRTRNQLEGVHCRRGSFPCVLGPRVAGMLAHEALGHLSEADYFSTGAFSELVGKQVAPENVTMCDSPRIRDAFGNISVDDECVRPRKVAIIRKGMLGELMTNREWASRYGTRPTGNARAESFRFPPIIRMRNTHFERGDMSFEEMVESIQFGYYCTDVRGGQAEANSSFQVGIPECYEIERGEVSAPVRDLAISGIALRALRLITGVGKDFGFESSYCGKLGQAMATSDGGPHLMMAKGAIIFGGSA